MLSKRQESLNQESWPLISSVFLHFCKLPIFRTKQLSEQGCEEKAFCRGFSSLFFLSYFGCAGLSLQNMWNRTLALALESRFSKPGPLGNSVADFRMGEWRWGKLYDSITELQERYNESLKEMSAGGHSHMDWFPMCARLHIRIWVSIALKHPSVPKHPAYM